MKAGNIHFLFIKFNDRIQKTKIYKKKISDFIFWLILFFYFTYTPASPGILKRKELFFVFLISS